MKNVTIYILTFSILLQICLTSKHRSKGVTGKKTSKVGHLIKTQSGKIYLHHPKKKKASSKKDTKKNSLTKDKKKKKSSLEKDFLKRLNRQGLVDQFHGTDNGQPNGRASNHDPKYFKWFKDMG